MQPRRVGQGGWGKGVGRGVGEALIEVLNKTGIVTFSLVIVKHFTRLNRPKSWGIPDFGGIPVNDIIILQKHHNLARKVRETRCVGDFTEIMLHHPRKKPGGHVGISAHFKISNDYCGVMDAFRGLKLIIYRAFGLI